MADSTLYLKLQDQSGDFVTGESTVQGFEQQIQLTSIQWGATSELPRENRPRASQQFSGGQWKPGSLTVKRDYDLASSRFYGDMAFHDMGSGGKPPYKKATITAVTFETSSDEIDLTTRATGGVTVLEIELTDVRINSVKLDSEQKDKGAALVETVEMKYGDITLKYYPPAPGGQRVKSPNTFQAKGNLLDSDKK